MTVRMPTAGATASDRGKSVVPVLVLLAGVVLLVVRPYAVVPGRLVLFAISYVVIAVASIAVPVEPDRAAIARPAVLGMGVAAVAGAAVLVGPPIPWPASAWAMPVSTLAAVAEEAVFRRVAFASLSRFGPVIAVAATATLFAAVHVPAYGLAAVPVDLGAGLLFGWQRWASGTWVVPMATHAAANIVAVLG